MSAGRRAGQRFDAEHHVTTEALIFLGALDPDAVGPGIKFATHYEPTPVDDAERLMDASPLDPRQTTFVDVGSGMGRVVLLAARRPFRQIIGVEISPALHEIARTNRACWSGADAAACRDIRLVCADATHFAFPRGDLVVYLYNPFRAPVLEAVLDALLAVAQRNLVVLYHTPVERATLDGRSALRVIAQLRCGLVYASRDVSGARSEVRAPIGPPDA